MPLELGDAQRGDLRIEDDFGGDGRDAILPQGEDLRGAAAAAIVIGADAVVMRVAFLDERFSRGERHDLVATAGRSPWRAQWWPAGPIALVFVTQGGNRVGPAVPDTRRPD